MKYTGGSYNWLTHRTSHTGRAHKTATESGTSQDDRSHGRYGNKLHMHQTTANET